MAQINQNDDTPPPYLPFPTFLAAIKSLRDHGLPTKIDKSAFSSRSGTDQRHIMGAFKFLKLIDSDDLPQPLLKSLHDSKPNSEDEKRILGELIKSNYSAVFNSVSLDSATPQQLRDAIGSYGIDGSTRDRAVRFFIKAAEHCNIVLSGRLTRVTRNRGDASVTTASSGAAVTTPKVAHKKRRGRPPRVEQPIVHNSDAPMKQISLPIANGTLVLSGSFNPFQLMGEERELVYSIIDKMNEYENKAKKNE